jgi:osmotically-inducible protein OsmY
MKKTSVSTSRVLKVSALITCLGALVIVGGVTGCAGTSTKQSTGEYIDDKAESARVKRALSADTEYKYDGVKVETFKGTVQLSGFVNSQEQKNRAGDLVKKIEGVREVVNNITVKESAQN